MLIQICGLPEASVVSCEVVGWVVVLVDESETNCRMNTNHDAHLSLSCNASDDNKGSGNCQS